MVHYFRRDVTPSGDATTPTQGPEWANEQGRQIQRWVAEYVLPTVAISLLKSHETDRQGPFAIFCISFGGAVVLFILSLLLVRKLVLVCRQRRSSTVGWKQLSSDTHNEPGLEFYSPRSTDGIFGVPSSFPPTQIDNEQRQYGLYDPAPVRALASVEPGRYPIEARPSSTPVISGSSGPGNPGGARPSALHMQRMGLDARSAIHPAVLQPANPLQAKSSVTTWSSKATTPTGHNAIPTPPVSPPQTHSSTVSQRRSQFSIHTTRR